MTTAPPFKKKTIKIPASGLHKTEFTVSYVDEGSGSVIVLLHSLLSTSAQFDPLIPLLVAEGYRVIAPDLPGCGGSSAEHLWNELETLAERVYKGHARDVVSTVNGPAGPIEIREGWDEFGWWLFNFCKALKLWWITLWAGDLGANIALGMLLLQEDLEKKDNEASEAARKKNEAGDASAWDDYCKTRIEGFRISQIVCQGVPYKGTPLREWWKPLAAQGHKGDLAKLFGELTIKNTYQVPHDHKATDKDVPLDPTLLSKLVARDHEAIHAVDHGRTHHRIARLLCYLNSSAHKADWGLADWAPAKGFKVIQFLPTQDWLYELATDAYGGNSPGVPVYVPRPRNLLETWAAEATYKFVELDKLGDSLYPPAKAAPAMPYTKRTMDVYLPGHGSCKVEYLDEGSGSKVVLLLHGLLTTSYQFAPMIPGLLSRGYRVVIPDLPGCGGSADAGLWGDGKTWADCGAWLDAFLSAAGVSCNPFSLVTCDMGGPFAQAYLRTSMLKDQRPIINLSTLNVPGARQELDMSIWNAIDTLADKSTASHQFMPDLKTLYTKGLSYSDIKTLTDSGAAGRLWGRDHAANFSSADSAAMQKAILSRYLTLTTRERKQVYDSGYWRDKTLRLTQTSGIIEWASCHGISVSTGRTYWDGLYVWDGPSDYNFGSIGVPVTCHFHKAGRAGDEDIYD